jgi:hypothetical protein
MLKVNVHKKNSEYAVRTDWVWESTTTCWWSMVASVLVFLRLFGGRGTATFLDLADQQPVEKRWLKISSRESRLHGCFDYNILCQTNRLEELSVWIKGSYLPPWVYIHDQFSWEVSRWWQGKRQGLEMTKQRACSIDWIGLCLFVSCSQKVTKEVKLLDH